MPVAESSQVPHGHQRAATAVDPDRVDVRAGFAFEDDKRKPPALRRRDQVDVCAMAQDEAVHQRLPDGGGARFVGAVDQAQRRPEPRRTQAKRRAAARASTGF